jgi:hypothetical protein
MCAIFSGFREFGVTTQQLFLLRKYQFIWQETHRKMPSIVSAPVLLGHSICIFLACLVAVVEVQLSVFVFVED